jgi:hypothetical protein
MARKGRQVARRGRKPKALNPRLSARHYAHGLGRLRGERGDVTVVAVRHSPVGTTPVALGGALAGPTGGLEPPAPRPVISILSVSSVTSTAPASSLTIPAFQRRRRIASPSSLGRSRAATSLSARPGDESAWKPSPISIAATRRRRLCRAVRRSAAGFRAIVGELEELRSGARRAADEAGSFYLRRTSRHPGPAVPAGSSARLLGHFARSASPREALSRVHKRSTAATPWVGLGRVGY